MSSENKKYRGIASGANIIALKVLDHNGNGNISDVLRGIVWILENKEKYNIRIANISVGANGKPELENESKLVKGVNELWDAGIVVCVAAGNNGPKPHSITIPGISRKVITVGASDDSEIVEVMGNLTSDYSGRGPTRECICKPDVVAPGSNIWSCRAISRSFFGTPKALYVKKSGTSMSTPVISGCVALVHSVNPALSNNDIKLILLQSAKNLGIERGRQGMGLIQVDMLLKNKYVIREI